MKRVLVMMCCLAALLACNEMQSQKEVIQTTKSGYRYIMTKDVAGTVIQPGQFALVHSVLSHEDSVITDTRMDNGRPTVVKVEAKGVERIGGSAPVQDLLELMSVGDSARLYYPVDSFPTVPPRFKSFKEVTYDIVVLDIFETEEEVQKFMDAERERINAPVREVQQREQEVSQLMTTFYESFKRGEKNNQWQTTQSGLKYIILEKGPSGLKAKPGETVRAHYYGVFEEDGKPFDNSFKRGSTLDFALGAGDMIRGWEEGFALLGKGDKAILLVPTQLAWGAQGFGDVIPPNKDVMFYVEMVGIGDLD